MEKVQLWGEKKKKIHILRNTKKEAKLMLLFYVCKITLDFNKNL